MNSNTWKFSELKIAKPDLNSYNDMFEDAILRVQEATSGEDVVQVILELDEMTRRADDLVRIAYIRNTMDTENPVYQEQLSWFDENMIYYDQAVFKFGEAVYNSPFREQIEKSLGSAYFIGADIQRKTFCEDAIELYQRERELCTEYQMILGACEAEIMGETRDLSKIRLLFSHEDRDVRKTAFKAFSEQMEKHEKRIGEIWDELIKLRNDIGRKLGHENFIPVGYLQNQHIYYTPEDVAEFRKQVVEEIVPLCEKLYAAQKERLGGTELMVYDEKVVFRDGIAHKIGDDEKLVEMARDMYHRMSRETGEFIDFMLAHELFEYKDRPGKEPGGYGLMLLARKAPFVFTHFDGTISDFRVITRDLGEAFARYKAARSQPIKEYYTASTDVMEIYALAMDQFAYEFAEDFFGEDADKYKFYDMQDLITFIPVGCAVDEFQHICYEHQELTPEERSLEWRKLEKKYMPWRKYDNDEFMERGGCWCSLSHIFFYPLYYIDYALARVHAMDIKRKYAMYPEITWRDYMNLIAQGGRIGYKDVVEQGNLCNLFQEGGVAKAMSYAKEVMDEYLEKKF